MPIVLPIIAFIFFRVIFKMGYDASIPIFANILICLGLAASAAVLNHFMIVRFGTQIAAKRFGHQKPTTRTFNPFLALVIIALFFSIFCWLISYGFSDKFFDWTWDDADDLFEISIIAFIFCIPLIAHYVVNKWALTVKLSQTETL